MQIFKTLQSRYYFTCAKLALAVLFPLTLIILPANFFDTGESICLSKLLLNVECYACGMTRACMHLIHLDIAGAYYYNTLSFAVLPIISIMWLSWAIKNWKKYKLQRLKMVAA
jgi:hypothetical protein